MKKLTLTEITALLNKEKENDDTQQQKFIHIENELVKSTETKAVLGIDIYKYSKYPNLPQMLIPYFFKNIYEVTLKHCFDSEPFIFRNDNKASLQNHFIDTGDGGFQIFDDPFKALIFAIYLQLNVIRYNSRHVNTGHIYDIIGEVTLRYSLTFDNIYSFEKNFYGTSIINCARIMSKDKLNRFLIDENTKKWFNHNFNGIETLLDFNIQEDSQYIDCLSDKADLEIKSLILGKEKNKINKIDLMKIGEISSKSDIISIHNLHLQVSVTSPSSKFKKLNVALGNLNITGLNE